MSGVGKIEDFLDCMPSTVTLEANTGLDKYGQRLYAAGTPPPARVQEKTERVAIASGEEVLARGRVYLGEITGVTTGYRITLPDSTTPEILAVSKVNDEDGPHHEVVIFK